MPTQFSLNLFYSSITKRREKFEKEEITKETVSRFYFVVGCMTEKHSGLIAHPPIILAVAKSKLSLG